MPCRQVAATTFRLMREAAVVMCMRMRPPKQLGVQDIFVLTSWVAAVSHAEQ